MEISLDNVAQVLAAVAAKYPGRARSAGSPGSGENSKQPDTAGSAEPDAAGSEHDIAGSAVPGGVVIPAGPAGGIEVRLGIIDAQLAGILATDPRAVSPASWLPILDTLEVLHRRLDAVYLRSVAAADQTGAAAFFFILTRNVQ